jgi:non-specific serine/threonine protein kinase
MASEQAVAFGAVLHRYRVAAQLTQEQLAARAGLSPDAIAALEHGRRHHPRTATLQRLEGALALGGAERQALLAAAGVPASASDADSQANLPTRSLAVAQPTPLIGRAAELATIRQRLVDDGAEGARLLTLTGPAGVGKTRLALTAVAALVNQAAGPIPDGVVLVDLTPIRDQQDVLPTIGRALGLTDTGKPPLEERLVAYLRERALLLVLDNVEQVLPTAAALLANLLGACPQLRLLVTSRVPLQLRWEQTLRVAPLPVPDLREELPPLDVLGQVPSVALFVERAQARRADFVLNEHQAPLVAQLVVQLDGLPLALELAAARLDVLPLLTLARRLRDRLRLLRWRAADVPERQQNLEAAVGWSYDLLSDDERRLFRCLGVFAGRVSVDAIAVVKAALAGDIEAIAGRADETGTLEDLMSLAEKSLLLPGLPYGHEAERGVIRERDGEEEVGDDAEPAFGMLETVREFAWDRLARQGELAAARRAHAHYFLALAERAVPLLHGHDQRAWFVRLEHEHDNLRAALRWLLDQDDGAEREAALRLAGTLGVFWRLRGYHTEGVRWLEEALNCASMAEAALRTKALLAAGVLLTEQGELDSARGRLEEALAGAQQRQDGAALAQSLIQLGYCALMTGDWAESTHLLQEALRRCQELEDRHGIAFTLLWLSQTAFAQGHVGDSLALVSNALARFEALGDVRLAGPIHFGLGVYFGTLNDLPRAVQHVRAGLEASVALQDRWLLGAGALATLALLGERAETSQHARLLGAADALGKASSATVLWERLPTYPSLARLREHLRGEGWEAAYRAGRSLPFRDVANLALTLLKEFRQTPAFLKLPVTKLPTTLDGPLSAREHEVLRLVAQGLTNKAIGRQLFIAASTVDYHLSSVFHKLGVDTRAQAVAVAAQRGLV